MSCATVLYLFWMLYIHLYSYPWLTRDKKQLNSGSIRQWILSEEFSQTILGYSLGLTLPFGLHNERSERTECRYITANVSFRNTWGIFSGIYSTFFLVSFWSCFVRTTSYKINFHLSYFPCPNTFQRNALGWLMPRWTCRLHLASLI